MALGPYCIALGIDEEVLTGDKSIACEVQNFTNGVVWELRKYKVAKKLPATDLTNWIIKICGLTCEATDIHEDLNAKIEKFISLREKFSKASKTYPGEVERLMKWQFDFPESMGVPPAPIFEPVARANLGPKLLKVLKEKGADDDDSIDVSGPDEDDDEQMKRRKAQEELVQLKKDLMTAKKIIVALNGRLSDLSKPCSLLTDLSKTSVSERKRIETSLAKISTEWNDILSTWHDCIQRLNDANSNKGKYLNVGYMVRRNKTKQGVFDELNLEFERTVEEFKYRVTSLIDKERQKKKPASREYKQKSRGSRKRASQDNGSEAEDSKKQRVDEEIQSKQGNISIDEFAQSEQVEKFMGGKFIPALKVIYTDLTTMQFSCPDVHEIIFSVLSDLENLNVEKIPSQYFAGNILMEAKMQVMLKAFSSLVKMSTSKVSNDSKTVFTLENSSYSVTLPDETKLLLGVRDLSHGSPETSLHFFKNMLNEIVAVKSESNIALQQAAKTIKSLLNDQHLLDKKIIEIIFLYKQQILPKLKPCLDLSELHKEKIFALNNFCATVYFFWGLSKLIDITLLAWEYMLETEGSIEFNPFEDDYILSKSLQQMGAFCLIVDPSAANELGQEFNTFLKQEKKLDNNPLAPCKNNLFNAVFHNSAGTWFYYETGFVREFIAQEKGSETDPPFNCFSNEAQNLAVFRALGLIGKLVTIPVWNAVEDSEVNVDDRYAALLKKVELWSKDASAFMKGEDQLFEDIPVIPDAVYVSLIKDNDVTDILTKELLQLIFTASASFIKSFLYGGSINGDQSVDSNSNLKSSIHEDLEIFDRITKNIHSLPTFAVDALTLYCKTRNAEWQEKLSGKNLAVLEHVRQYTEKQMKNLYKRKIVLNDIREQASGEKEEVGKGNLIEKRYKLIDEIVKWGGLWKSEKEVDERLKNMSEVDRLKALKAQILFRRHVLCETHEKHLLDLAFDGECFNYVSLSNNLKSVLRSECQLTETDVFELASATDDEEAKSKIFESCKSAVEVSDEEEVSKNFAVKENFYWLLGKLISHKFMRTEGGQAQPMTGVCIARKKVEGIYFYFMRYKELNHIFKFSEYQITHDYKNQKLRVVDPHITDMIGSCISRAFFKDDGDLEWHDCRVIGVLGPGPEFVIEFEFYGYNLPAGEIPDIEILTFTSYLLEDYRTDRLRFL